MDVFEEKISSYIAENILFSKNGYPYPKDASFTENQIVDEIKVLELVLFLEENFALQVADDEMTPENFDSVERISNYVRGKQQN